jgi:hypothetical protein
MDEAQNSPATPPVEVPQEDVAAPAAPVAPEPTTATECACAAPQAEYFLHPLTIMLVDSTLLIAMLWLMVKKKVL